MNAMSVTGEQLAGALHVLAVDFILDGTTDSQRLQDHPEWLITALAESPEARLRLSLIPLFLEHPEFSRYARKAAQGSNEAGRVTLHCYYTAAVLLQRMHGSRLEGLIGLRQVLPDVFSKPLGLRLTSDVEGGLSALAGQHQRLSGLKVNWLGTYQHAFQVWVRGLEIRKS